MGKKRRHEDKMSNRSDLLKGDSTAKHTGSTGHGFGALRFFFVAFIVFMIYSNTLKGPFVFDDLNGIRENSHIRLTSLTLGGAKKVDLLKGPSPQRPVANISFALNYYVHRYNVSGYHLVNILIHVATGLFLYLFVKTTLNMPAFRSGYESYKWIPFFTVLIWLVHPIQTQSVTYIVQRMNSMAAMFYVLTLLLYAKARLTETKGKRRLLFAACLLSGILSLGSKEIAATLPFFIFLYEWYFFQDLSRPWLRRRILPLAGVIIILCLLASIYLGSHPLEKIAMTYQKYDFSLSQRVLTEFRVVIFYISLLIFPHPSRLNIDHDFPISHSLSDPISTLLALGLIAGLIAVAVFMAKKERLVSFCILWFLGNLVIESSVIGLELLYEHRLYLPSMLVILLLVLLAQRYVRSKWMKIGMLCAVMTIFSFWTHERNSVWRDDLILWKDCVEKSPKKARSNYNMGVALDHRARYEAAANHYIEALRIKPGYANAHYNLGVVLLRQEQIEKARSHFSEALRIRPQFSNAHNNLGITFLRQRKHEAAISHFFKALQIKPDYAKAHYNLGVALSRLKKHEKAIGHFFEALRIEPNDFESHYDLGNTLMDLGRIEEAIGHYAKALRIKPDEAEVHKKMGMALKQQGRFGEAVSHYAEALRIKPEDAGVHNTLGNALAGQKKFEQAIGHYAEALRINPDHANAHNNMGVALERQGRFDEAISHYVEVLRIKPDHANAHNNMGVALKRQGRIDEAIGHYVEALRIKPDHYEAHYNMGNALRKQGRIEKAISHYVKAIRINPEDARAHHELGNALVGRKKFEQAINHYSEALRIMPEDAELHNNMGVALANLGRLNKAMEHFSEALRIKPDSASARRNLKQGLRFMNTSVEASNASLKP